MSSEKWIYGLVVVTGLIPIVLIVLKLRFGSEGAINPYRVRCPRCDAKMPHIRVPMNERQETWVGWTCFKCGTEMDKWGKEVALS
jgi:hypothetical protein